MSKMILLGDIRVKVEEIVAYRPMVVKCPDSKRFVELEVQVEGRSFRIFHARTNIFELIKEIDKELGLKTATAKKQEAAFYEFRNLSRCY
jgi:hypothetical protein